MSPDTFQFCRKNYVYYDHPHNDTRNNERAVEIPIVVTEVLGNPKASVLEVGDVLSNYDERVRINTVVDLSSERAGVVQEDILNFSLTCTRRFDMIVSISTFEHIGIEDATRDPARAVDVIRQLPNLLNPKGQLLFTIPLGYNHVLDSWLFSKGWKGSLRTLLKITENDWVEVYAKVARRAEYGRPFPAGNAVAVCSLSAE